MRLQPVELDWASVDPLPDEVDVCFDDSPAEFERCFPAFDAPEVDGEVLESFEFVAEVLEVLKEIFCYRLVPKHWKNIFSL